MNNSGIVITEKGNIGIVFNGKLRAIVKSISNDGFIFKVLK